MHNDLECGFSSFIFSSYKHSTPNLFFLSEGLIQFNHVFNYQVKMWFHYSALIVCLDGRVVLQDILFISFPVIYILIRRLFIFSWANVSLTCCNETVPLSISIYNIVMYAFIHHIASFIFSLFWHVTCQSGHFFLLTKWWTPIFCSPLFVEHIGLHPAYMVDYLVCANGPAVACRQWVRRWAWGSCIVEEAAQGSWTVFPSIHLTFSS